jgi:hypothetical protein
VQVTPTFFFNPPTSTPPPRQTVHTLQYTSPMAIQILPEICISPAPPSENLAEPFSPFDNVHFALEVDEDGFRPALLSPPPSMMSIPKHLSPLSPPDAPVKGQGLERERFERLLKSSRERSAALGNKKSPDLRKELALKTYKSKQSVFPSHYPPFVRHVDRLLPHIVERRARFLIKVSEPPCPSAAYEPKTPPDSPAIYNYSLPSPGLVSPLTMYEYLEEECVTSNPWTEQVDFRLPQSAVPSKRNCPALCFKGGRGLPSLDEITARLSFKNISGARQTSLRLPAFLQKKQAAAEPVAAPITIGRLRLPGSRSRGASPPPEQQAYRTPPSPVTPRLQVTTTVIPKMLTSNPVHLTESNLEAFSRSQLPARRRSLALPSRVPAPTTPIEERAFRRRSAPAELPLRARTQFKHPVLDLPGGF